MLNLLPKNFKTSDIISRLSQSSTQLFNNKIDMLSDIENNQDLWLIPPIVDLCSRLGNISGRYGTLISEGSCARQNGLLHIVIPPDTTPVLETSTIIKDLCKQAYDKSGIHLYVLGALTEGLMGERPANVEELKSQGGCIAVTNAGRPFTNDLIMLRTLEYASTFDLKVFFYPNEPSLSAGGVAHEGYIASFHGLKGIPWIAETVALSKQLLMVEETGITAHFSQLTTKSSVELIRWAKDKGLPVTCDVAMHQLHLTDDSLEGFNPLAYVLPPLRSNTDQIALRKGLADGTIDAICSHHEPLSMTAKQAPFSDTKAGISNFDTFISLGCKLVNEGLLSPEQLIEKICLNPSRIAGIEEKYQNIGGAVLIDVSTEWKLTADSMLSEGKNTPFIEQTLIGKVIATLF